MEFNSGFKGLISGISDTLEFEGTVSSNKNIWIQEEEHTRRLDKSS
jgi:hypothetical protein